MQLRFKTVNSKHFNTELVEKLMNTKHDILSDKEAKNRRRCHAPGIKKIIKQATMPFKQQSLKLREKVVVYNPKFTLVFQSLR